MFYRPLYNLLLLSATPIAVECLRLRVIPVFLGFLDLCLLLGAIPVSVGFIILCLLLSVIPVSVDSVHYVYF